MRELLRRGQLLLRFADFPQIVSEPKFADRS